MFRFNVQYVEQQKKSSTQSFLFLFFDARRNESDHGIDSKDPGLEFDYFFE